MSEVVDLSGVPVLEVGGTHVTAAVVEAGEWRIRRQHRAELPADGSREAIVATMAHTAREIAPGPDAVWGVAMPDPFDYEGGVAWFAGVGKFESLYGVDLGYELRDALPGRPAALRFVNDAEAFAIGEWVAGAALDAHRCAALTLGTGIGSAFLVDGRPVSSGPGVPPGGRAHRLELGGRPLEDMVSRRAIRAAYVTAGGDAADVREIAARARTGEGRANTVLEAAFRTLGAVLGPAYAEFGADVVVVGGSMAGSWDLIGPLFDDGCQDAGIVPPATVLAADAEGSPLIGAAWYAGLS